MADKYYIISKDIGDGGHLMGLLERLGYDEYSFKYLIKGDTFPYWFMEIPNLSDIHKVYGTDEVKRHILARMVHDEGTLASKWMMEQNGITKYNYWDIFESQMRVYIPNDKYPFHDSHKIMYFYQEMPPWRVNRYDG
ncbi:MAG: hypothetical protein LBM93_13065 [Oscillospiraceae bacterium]|nr:hypothetical protein [Oscillospiraceae bacterium]